ATLLISLLRPRPPLSSPPRRSSDLHVRMGPRALLQLLQPRLGLTRPPVEGAVRIAQYLRLIERHLATPSGARSFWPARSFAVDPWSTASQLLRWRDATVEAGWRMGAQPAERHEGLPPR